MPTQKKEASNYGSLIAVIAVPIISFIGGMALNAFTIAEKLATKPYVDDRIVDVKKYTDEKTAQVLKDAFEHADTSRREALNETQKLFQEVQVHNAVLETKVDTLVKAMQDMREWASVRRKTN